MFTSCLDQGCPAARRELHASSGFNAGQVEDAKKLLAAWVYAWTQFDGLPDLFDMAATERLPLQKVHHSQPPFHIGTCIPLDCRFQLLQSKHMMHAV